MHVNAQAPPNRDFFVLVAKLLVQDLHHRRPPLGVLNQHAASTADIVDNLDDFAEARCCATGLCEASEAEVCALAMFEDDEELDDEGHRLNFEVWRNTLLAADHQTRREQRVKRTQHYIAESSQPPGHRLQNTTLRAASR